MYNARFKRQKIEVNEQEKVYTWVSQGMASSMGTVGLGYPPQMWLIAQAPSLTPVLPPPPVLGRGADCGERHLTAQNIQSIKT